MNAICLVIDRLHVGYLGCYGNSWIRTPTFDRLAAEGFAFDRALTDSPRLAEVYESYWSGIHGLWRRGRPVRGCLPRELAAAGVSTTLVTDDARLAGHPRAGEFAALVNLASAPPVQSAETVEQTQLARLFAGACDALDSAREPFCLWMHAGALDHVWDAPFELRDLYAEEDEPAPPELVAVPRQLLGDDHDPDQRWGMCQAYAAQVSLVDLCLSALLEWFSANPAGRRTLLVVTAPRGFPLGEHGRVGAWDEALHAELVHVPWLIRFPDLWGATGRSPALVQPADLAATLLDWFGLPAAPRGGTGLSLLPLVENEETVLRDRACVTAGDGEQGICTPAWYLRVTTAVEESRTGSQPDANCGGKAGPGTMAVPIASPASSDTAMPSVTVRLYKKPDDLWEVNDVADRCVEVVDALQRALADVQAAAASDTQSPPPPVDEVLISGHE
jgi:Sulfatase